MTDFGAVSSNTSLRRTVALTIEDFRKGATAPTDSTIGTTPTVPALRFDATNELLTLQVHMPHEWNQGDVILMLDFVLTTLETDLDVLSLTIDYVATQSQATGEGPGKASTQLTPTLTLTTANGLADGDQYTMEVTIAAADATNPLANADFLVFEFHLTNLTDVAAIDFIGGCVEFVARH